MSKLLLALVSPILAMVGFALVTRTWVAGVCESGRRGRERCELSGWGTGALGPEHRSVGRVCVEEREFVWKKEMIKNKRGEEKIRTL